MPAALPSTMRAWHVTRASTPPSPRDSLSLTFGHPLPPNPPTGTNILIRVSYAALNPVDAVILSLWVPFRRAPLPGLDFVGSIVAVGPGVPPQVRRIVLSPGTVICGALGFRQVVAGWGTLAEYVSVPIEMVAFVPERVDVEPRRAVGACGIAGQTTVLIVREAEAAFGCGAKAGAAEKKEVWLGKRVLINGASGSVGSMLVQVLKGKGAELVAGICSGTNEAYIKGLGADEAVDYTAQSDLYQHLAEKYAERPFDLIIDCVGDDDLYKKCPPYLQPKGKFLSIVSQRAQGLYEFFMNQLRPTFLGGTPRSYKILGLTPSGTYAREVVRWLEEGLLKEVPIDSEYEMDDVVKAYDRLMTKRAKGKIVVRVNPEA